MLGLVIAFPNPRLVPNLHLRRLSGWAKYESMSNFTQQRKKSLTWEYQWSHNNLLPGLQSFRQLRLEKKTTTFFSFFVCRWRQRVSERAAGTPQRRRHRKRRRAVRRARRQPVRDSPGREEELPTSGHLLRAPRAGGCQVKNPLPAQAQGGQASLA